MKKILNKEYLKEIILLTIIFTPFQMLLTSFVLRKIIMKFYYENYFFEIKNTAIIAIYFFIFVLYFSFGLLYDKYKLKNRIKCNKIVELFIVLMTAFFILLSLYVDNFEDIFLLKSFILEKYFFIEFISGSVVIYIFWRYLQTFFMIYFAFLLKKLFTR